MQRKDSLGVSIEPMAGFRQKDVSALPQEQRAFQDLFESLDALTDGRLRQT